MRLQAVIPGFPCPKFERQIREFCRTFGYSVSEIFFHCGNYTIGAGEHVADWPVIRRVDDLWHKPCAFSRGEL
jgi:hypothetical protein